MRTDAGLLGGLLDLSESGVRSPTAHALACRSVGCARGSGAPIAETPEPDAPLRRAWRLRYIHRITEGPTHDGSPRSARPAAARPGGHTGGRARARGRAARHRRVPAEARPP